MSRNVTEAARGASEIAKNIAGVAEAAQSTSHGAGDSQRAAQQLTAMSTELARTRRAIQVLSRGRDRTRISGRAPGKADKRFAPCRPFASSSLTIPS